ncbi:MAG: Maf family protein [Lachnospiraceae bacterium]|nr:Maf family protein [Lachnospiraceae bacterium]
MKYRIILASGSPRRKELMDRIGSDYIAIPSEKEEDMSGHDPAKMVEMLSSMKAEDIAERIKKEYSRESMDAGLARMFSNTDLKNPIEDDFKNCVIIGCDTVVAFENTILGKPVSEEDAFDMIKSYAGRTHHVHTGVCILVTQDYKISKKLNYSVSTKVNVVTMTDQEIRSYIATGEPMDKAGAYAIQGLFCPYIDSIEGDYYNIVGYPIASVFRSFKELGIDIRTGQEL